MTTASIRSGWAARAAELIGDRSALAALAAAEKRLGTEWASLDSAILAALHGGSSIAELSLQSERSSSYVRRLRDGDIKVKPVAGDARALALRWYETYSDMMSLAAYAHLVLGVKQVEVARVTGYSPSTVNSWVKSARSIG